MLLGPPEVIAANMADLQRALARFRPTSGCLN